MATSFPDVPLEIERQNGDVTVRVKDQKVLDETAVQTIRDSLLALADQVAATTGVLKMDFKDVEYLGSAMLETLIKMYRRLKPGSKAPGTGGRLVLRNLQPQVYEVFEVTKLHELFEIHTESQ